VQSGGLRVNDQAVTDDKATLTKADVSADGVVKLSMGKKRHVLLRPV
jgi:tyrosyl-tRNA synthetase